MQLVFMSGSLRQASFNTAFLRALAERVPENCEVVWADIGSLPLFNQDDEAAEAKPAVRQLRDMVAKADGVVISSPEYNHSIPGVLKNAIDWLSRPPGKSVWKGKPVMLAGASPSFVGTARAQQHLKQVFTAVQARLFIAPEVCVAGANDKVDADGTFVDDSALKFAGGVLADFIAFI